MSKLQLWYYNCGAEEEVCVHWRRDVGHPLKRETGKSISLEAPVPRQEEGTPGGPTAHLKLFIRKGGEWTVLPEE